MRVHQVMKLVAVGLPDGRDTGCSEKPREPLPGAAPETQLRARRWHAYQPTMSDACEVGYGWIWHGG